jgi:hypothetical protein
MNRAVPHLFNQKLDTCALISRYSKEEVAGNIFSHEHDYYSIWFNLSAAFFISEKKAKVIKLKTHYFISYHVMKC